MTEAAARDAGGGARFSPGDRVRTFTFDPPYHTRLPRYARGQVGEIVEAHGTYPVPDDRARRLPGPRMETVYTVRFAARDLWGEGSHAITIDLWESYLEPATAGGCAGVRTGTGEENPA